MNGHHGIGMVRGLDSTPHSSIETGRFGRMFRRLPPAVFEEADLRALAQAMKGEPATEDKPLGVPDDEENGDIPAGYTYLGQFIDHDITFDPASSLTRQNDPNALTNFRTPRLDLDSLYGRGPDDQPYLYADSTKFLIPADGDLPRGPNGRALIGDPRNDENRIVSQLHTVFLRFHNAMVDRVAADGVPKQSLFQEAQRRVRWHYQWVVIHDFLERVAGTDVVNDILPPVTYQAGGAPRTIVQPKLLFYHFRHTPFMPVEFSAAAYRFGHSMVRPSYHLNGKQRAKTEGDRKNNKRTTFRIPVFSDDRIDSLDGFQPLPKDRDFHIEWDFFFTGRTGTPGLPQPSYRIDTSLAGPLAGLLRAGIVHDVPSALAERNLLRGLRLGLPSGQNVAMAMGIDPLTEKELAAPDAEDAKGLAAELVQKFKHHTPLWFYILKEAAVRSQTKRLGPVGARIVAEVIIGLIAADPTSYLGVHPNWQPAGGTFTMSDLLKAAGAR